MYLSKISALAVPSIVLHVTNQLVDALLFLDGLQKRIVGLQFLLVGVGRVPHALDRLIMHIQTKRNASTE